MDKRFNKEESKSIKDILGNGYGKQILAYLNEKRIFNSKNEPFSIEYLYQIVNGQKSSDLIQDQILDLVAIKRNEIAMKLEKRKQLLQ